MPVLFSALLPPEDVVAGLAAALGETGDGLRWEPPERWHITLAYYGPDDVGTRAAWLGERLTGRPAVDVRLEKAATFPGVLWLTVAGPELTPLANAAGAGAEPRPYRAHLTLARFPREEPGLAARWTERLANFTSRQWRAAEVALMTSERERGGPRYSVARSFELDRG
ncbi:MULTISPECIES: RNA 2',3'-cyclic phosphodiesterase [unclassified Amycolatopsis]|uniref:RNA 2',3'-cyclic phosphodiesterase n=1 Tax=unclassified Amycolatopsis TaxID=2618356 RepID=UPI002876A1A8|nr:MULTISPECIES: RNA 2',3'-cyclic phosphodiesterase [unclassified Amycolatopsis]MDS0136591.1 RNA 2',3'-cyclic phosphodiesterase [Amycolatopsis sp. 505]MDS0143255.1 RNA 2',3'-cyclic phosphodiesterase [Amycolatopsis sp. CM201R]